MAVAASWDSLGEIMAYLIIGFNSQSPASSQQPSACVRPRTLRAAGLSWHAEKVSGVGAGEWTRWNAEHRAEEDSQIPTNLLHPPFNSSSHHWSQLHFIVRSLILYLSLPIYLMTRHRQLSRAVTSKDSQPSERRSFSYLNLKINSLSVQDVRSPLVPDTPLNKLSNKVSTHIICCT